MNPEILADQENMLRSIWVVIYIIILLCYLLKSWGLYMISKKLWENHSWLAFVPLIQFYTHVKAAGKSGLWVLWIILWYILFVIPGLILYIITLSGISKRTGRWGWTTAGLFFFPVIMFPVVGYKLQATTPNNENIQPTQQEIV